MNISQLLQEIHSTGLSDEEIGTRIGAPQSIVFRLRTGVHKSTGFERGSKIQKLHTELMEELRTSPVVLEANHAE